ncbi:MAG: amino acid ABC transporter ATP-binding protein, partial [Clostridia bacterium]|nr:amino acid ABC transporter ATP-binding protein [Clostridia bacterium]
MIEVKNLVKDFGKHNEIHVLKGITTEIKQGEKVVVVGPSGGGKSTFLRCLNLLETPTSGEIWFEGQQINAKSTDINKVRQNMGMVFQHFNLFPHLSIMKNITIAPVKLGLCSKEEADERANTLLKRIGLSDKANAYPSQLSGG